MDIALLGIKSMNWSFYRYFTAKSALEYGLIDRILQMPRTQALR